MFGISPRQLRDDLLESGSADLRRRRAVIGLSLAGLAGMGAVTLLQTGLVKHLPDPPVAGFDTDKVTLSDEAYQFGAPDATAAVASLATNLPLAAFGPEDRARRQPWVPLLASAKAVADAAVTAWYFRQMRRKEHAWCTYCILGGLANLGVLALNLPEAVKAIRCVRA